MIVNLLMYHSGMSNPRSCDSEFRILISVQKMCPLVYFFLNKPKKVHGSYYLPMQYKITYLLIYFTEIPSTAELLEQNGKTLTPTKAALLLTKKNSVRHQAVINERDLELAENNADSPSDSQKLLKQQNLPSDSQKLLKQQNPNSVNQDSMLVIPLKQSPSLHRKHHWENELKECESLKEEDISSNCAH